MPTLYNKYVVPFLAANNLVNRTTCRQRAAGARSAIGECRKAADADDYETNGQMYAAGVDGNAWGWIYNATRLMGRRQIHRYGGRGYTDTN